jgi:hypothetical protein
LEIAILSLIDWVESLRVSALRLTLSHPILRRIFRHRPARLLCLFVASFTLYLPLSFYFPLWVLAIGPLVWGIPHIVASIRYQHYIFAKNLEERGRVKVTLIFTGIIWAMVVFFRVYTDFFHSTFFWDRGYPGLIETAFGGIILGGLFVIFRSKPIEIFLAALGLISFTVLIFLVPVETAAVLILAHNFVAFFYWIFASRTRADRVVAITATVIFSLIHILVLRKVFDSLINLSPGPSYLPWAQLSLESLGRSIAPHSRDWSVWYRCLTLYAFGQSLHYFVWLKAIPDLFTPSQNPTSFKTAWQTLKKDMGMRPALLASVATVVPLVVWTVLGFNYAFRLYFAIASLHGYMEIAGLGFFLSRRV